MTANAWATRRGYLSALTRAVVLLAGVGVTQSGCTARPTAPPPLAFADSQAFHGVASETRGFFERDVDGDGLVDAVVVRQHERGFVLEYFQHTRATDTDPFERRCELVLGAGDELDTLRALAIGGGAQILIVTRAETPDLLAQRVTVVDATDPCRVLQQTAVETSRTSDALVLPPQLVLGVLVSEPGDRVLMLDQPKVVRLHDVQAAGEVALALSLRVRTLAMAHPPTPRDAGGADVAALAVAEQTVQLLVGRKVVPEVQGVPALVSGAASKADHGDAEAGAIRLRIGAERDFVAVEVRHACGVAPALERPHLRAEGARDGALLWLLDQPAAEAGLVLAAGDRADCVSAVRVFRWSGGETDE